MKLIFEKSQSGRRASSLPKPDVPAVDIPAHLRRDAPPRLPELAEHAKRRLQEAGLQLLFPGRATFKEFAVRAGRSGRVAISQARERGVHPGYALGRDYPELDDALLVAFTEKRTPLDIERLVEVLAA